MRACIQRVHQSKVVVADEVVGEIGPGMLVLLGVEVGDNDAVARAFAAKICGLRIFADEEDKMNLPLAAAGGEMLVVSQFTLLGDCRKGKRPSFIQAAEPAEAERLYGVFVEAVRRTGIHVATGRFRTHMDVSLVNDGPVTLLLDSQKAF